jgi:3D (Asp-Asp-Asp) domain-containing protein
VNNIHRQNEEVRRKYLLYINQQFDMDLRIRRSIFNQQFVLSIEENKKREREKSEKKSLSRGGTIQEEMFVLTFYTSLNEENGYGPITCGGSRLRDGIVANNVLSQGTVIMTKEYGELIVADRGGDNFNVRHRLDVFVPRNKGESDYQYKKRVNAMGIVKVKGYIIK